MDKKIYIGNDETFLKYGSLYEVLEVDNLCFTENPQSDRDYLIYTSDDFMDIDVWRLIQLKTIIQ